MPSPVDVAIEESIAPAEQTRCPQRRDAMISPCTRLTIGVGTDNAELAGAKKAREFWIDTKVAIILFACGCRAVVLRHTRSRDERNSHFFADQRTGQTGDD